MLKPLWIDTDPGIDDAIAIVASLRQRQSRVAGMSIVYGNVDEASAYRNLSWLLETQAQAFTLPRGLALTRGAVMPLLREPVYAHEVHGEDGLGNLTSDYSPSDHTAAVQGSAYAALLDLAPRGKRFEGVILAIGPLTNLATTILCDRSWPQRISRLVIMGGSINAGGNATPAAEFNFYSDPEAAHIVVSAGFPRLDLVPIDAGSDLALTPELWRAISRSNSPSGLLTKQLLSYWRREAVLPEVIIYDLIAAVAVDHPDTFTWKDHYIDVDHAGGPADGSVVIDRRRSSPPPNCRIALGADTSRFWEHAWDALLGAQ